MWLVYMASDHRPAHHVAVLGAGVIGLPLATHLVETYPQRLVVTVIAEKFSPNTTSDVSGAVTQPLAQGNSSDAEFARVKRWCCATHDYVNALYKSPDASKAGVTRTHGCFACPDTSLFPEHDQWYRYLYHGLHQATETEKALYPAEKKDDVRYVFSTFILCCRTYLPWLRERFTQHGGIIVQKKVASLSELSSYDVVINCTGVGAGVLASDPNVYPGKGVAMCVDAPWVNHMLAFSTFKSDMTYIFPRNRPDGKKEVVLGGTCLIGDYSETADEDVCSGILERCQAVMPSLTGAKVLDTWIGHRPIRKGGVRLEKEEGSHDPVIIHCYGHGGAGVTLHWGCVLDITDLLRDTLALDTSKL